MLHSSLQTAAFRLVKAAQLEVNPIALTTKSGSAMQNVPAGSTFVTIRESAGLGHYFITEDSPSAKQTAYAVAQAVSARFEEAEVPDLGAGASAFAHLTFQRGSIPSDNNQQGTDISSVIDAVASTLLEGEWVAMSVRDASRNERKWQRRWLANWNKNTHHSLNVNSVVTSMWAGGHSAGNAKAILNRVSSALPGFDLHTTKTSVGKSKLAGIYAGGAALVASVTWVGAELFGLTSPWLGFSAAGLIAAAAILTAAGRLPSPLTRLRSRLRSGLVPKAPPRIGIPAKPERQTQDKEGNIRPARDGDYPLNPASFLVSSVIPVSLIAPHSGAESGTTSTQVRHAPPHLRERLGPLIGNNSDAPVHLDAGDMWQGIMCIGQAGSGKSALLQALWGYAALAKVRDSGIPGTPGAKHAMIAIDNKGDGLSAHEYKEWADAAGAPTLTLNAADANELYGIDLFPDVGTAEQRARRVISAMTYFYGDISIGPESFDTLVRLFHAAYMVTPDVASQVPGVATDGSAFYYANILVTNRGDELGKALAAALIDKAGRENAAPGSDLFDATEGLKPMYDPARTPAQRQQLMKAPRTKVSRMFAAEHWWSRPRTTTWEKILTSHAAVIINTGMSPDGQFLDKETSALLSSMILFTLHEEIQRHCVGWFEKGETVTIYADELKQIANESAEVITWIRNDARSFGVRAVFATQYPEQLKKEVRDAVMGFGTLITYAQQNVEMIGALVKQLCVDGSEWVGADISGLPRYEAIVRTSFNGSAQTPFTLSIPNFRAWRGEVFAELQGLAA